MPRKINIPVESDLPLHSWSPYSAMHKERIRAHKKHEAKDGSMETKTFDHPIWLAVLAEEFGEVARVLCENELGNLSEVKPQLREELVQLGAMTAAWIDAIDLDMETEPFADSSNDPNFVPGLEKSDFAKEQADKPYRWGTPSPLFGNKQYNVGGFVKAILNEGERLKAAINPHFIQKENIRDSLIQISHCNAGGPGECPACTDRVKWIMEQLGIEDES